MVLCWSAKNMQTPFLLWFHTVRYGTKTIPYDTFHATHTLRIGRFSHPERNQAQRPVLLERCMDGSHTNSALERGSLSYRSARYRTAISTHCSLPSASFIHTHAIRFCRNNMEDECGPTDRPNKETFQSDRVGIDCKQNYRQATVGYKGKPWEDATHGRTDWSSCGTMHNGAALR